YGYNDDRAKRAAYNDGEKLKAAVREICQRRNYTCGDSGYSPTQVRIVNWSEEIEKNLHFQSSLAEVMELYASNQKFRNAVRNMTKKSVQTRIDHNSKAKEH